jgi:hypothetical protein
MERRASELDIQKTPLSLPLYDNPAIRFIMLGEPIENQGSADSGKVRFKTGDILRELEWATDSKKRIMVKSFVLKGEEQRVLTLAATFMKDRSSGSIERISNNKVNNTTSFVRSSTVEPDCDITKIFPKGLNAIDYTSGSGAVTTTWGGEFDAPGEPMIAKTDNTGKYALVSVGAIAILAGFLKLRRRKTA